MGGLEEAQSSPYNPPVKKGDEGTFGWASEGGKKVAGGYKEDVSREKEAFKMQEGIVRAQGPNIESKTWWLARDSLREQVYELKQNMNAISFVAKDAPAAKKAYQKFLDELSAFDQAMDLKKGDAAKKEYGDLLAALDAWK